jgi:hypothetical protein
MDTRLEELYARRDDEQRYFARFRAATPEAQSWAHRYLADASLGPPETLEQKAGWLLFALAPSRWRWPALADPGDDLDTIDEQGE